MRQDQHQRCAKHPGVSEFSDASTSAALSAFDCQPQTAFGRQPTGRAISREEPAAKDSSFSKKRSGFSRQQGGFRISRRCWSASAAAGQIQSENLLRQRLRQVDTTLNLLKKLDLKLPPDTDFSQVSSAHGGLFVLKVRQLQCTSYFCPH